jgi:hypothetical protein
MAGTSSPATKSIAKGSLLVCLIRYVSVILDGFTPVVTVLVTPWLVDPLEKLLGGAILSATPFQVRNYLPLPFNTVSSYNQVSLLLCAPHTSHRIETNQERALVRATWIDC